MNLIKKNLVLFIVLILFLIVSLGLAWKVYNISSDVNKSIEKIQSCIGSIETLNKKKPAPLPENYDRIKIDTNKIKKKLDSLKLIFGNPYRNALRVFALELFTVPYTDMKGQKNTFINQKTSQIAKLILNDDKKTEQNIKKSDSKEQETKNIKSEKKKRKKLFEKTEKTKENIKSKKNLSETESNEKAKTNDRKTSLRSSGNKNTASSKRKAKTDSSNQNSEDFKKLSESIADEMIEIAMKNFPWKKQSPLKETVAYEVYSLLKHCRTKKKDQIKNELEKIFIDIQMDFAEKYLYEQWKYFWQKDSSRHSSLVSAKQFFLYDFLLENDNWPVKLKEKFSKENVEEHYYKALEKLKSVLADGTVELQDNPDNDPTTSNENDEIAMDLLFETMGVSRTAGGRLDRTKCAALAGIKQLKLENLLRSNNIELGSDVTDFSSPPIKNKQYIDVILAHWAMVEDLVFKIIKANISKIDSISRNSSLPVEHDVFENGGYMNFKYDISLTGKLESIREFINLLQDAYIDNRIYIIKKLEISKITDEASDIKATQKDLKKEISDLAETTTEESRKEKMQEYAKVIIGREKDNLVKLKLSFEYIVYTGNKLKSGK